MTEHKIYITDNKELCRLEPSSVHLTVTSPPYVTTEFKRGQEFDYDGFLDHFSEVCEQLYRITVPGGRFALNIADIISKYRYEDDSIISRIPLGPDTFSIAKVGVYAGKCAELCGVEHARMLFNVRVVEPAEYEQYFADLKARGQGGLFDTGLSNEAGTMPNERTT